MVKYWYTNSILGGLRIEKSDNFPASLNETPPLQPCPKIQRYFARSSLKTAIRSEGQLQ